MRLRLTGDVWATGDPLGEELRPGLGERKAEADEFYAAVIPAASRPKRRA